MNPPPQRSPARNCSAAPATVVGCLRTACKGALRFRSVSPSAPEVPLGESTPLLGSVMRVFDRVRAECVCRCGGSQGLCAGRPCPLLLLRPLLFLRWCRSSTGGGGRRDRTLYADPPPPPSPSLLVFGWEVPDHGRQRRPKERGYRRCPPLRAPCPNPLPPPSRSFSTHGRREGRGATAWAVLCRLGRL